MLTERERKILEAFVQNDIKLDRFGENGKPVLFLDEDDIERVNEKEFDPHILKENSRY